MLGTAPARK